MKLKMKKKKRDYTIIVPTRGRYDNVRPLSTLGLPIDKFVLCVNDDQEKIKYREHYPNVEIWVSDTNTCIDARNYCLARFNEGEKIIMVDDDVDGLFEQRGPGRQGLVKMTGDEIDILIKKGFAMCEVNGTKLWGVYPVFNHFFMSRSIIPHGFIVGMWMGIIVSDERFDTNIKLKDDYGFTCQHILRFKKVVRFNYVCVKAKYHTNAGGGSEYRTDEMQRQDVEYLIRKYPNWIVKNNNREGHEILLKFRTAKGE